MLERQDRSRNVHLHRIIAIRTKYSTTAEYESEPLGRLLGRIEVPAKNLAYNSPYPDKQSPRAFDASSIPENDLFTMFEAARWAPSAFNAQPWRFLYAMRDDPYWTHFLSFLIPFNASWARNASALVYVLSETLILTGGELTPSHSHSFDAGAAWALLALQAKNLGYDSHGMSGIDFAQARAELSIPGRLRTEAAVAIGRRADGSSLPETLRAREGPSNRKPIEELVFHGRLAE
jgi:nitroreductase